jgi:hypothetical protein
MRSPSVTKETREISQTRLRTALRARGVSQIQVVYCAFEGISFATLLASRLGPDMSRIHLPRYLRKELRRFFDHRMSLAYPTGLDAADYAGTLQWDLRINTISHKCCGYRRQFFSADEILDDRPEGPAEVADIA